MKKRTGLNIIAALIILTAVSLAIYRYGYRIPVLKEIPFFSHGHEHEWRPVLTAEGEIDYWTCAMHPSVKMKEPGTCPICGMELIPVPKKPDTETGPPSEDGTNEGVVAADNEKTSDTGAIDHSRHGTGVPPAPVKDGETERHGEPGETADDRGENGACRDAYDEKSIRTGEGDA
jgi:hypothetical protein